MRRSASTHTAWITLAVTAAFPLLSCSRTPSGKAGDELASTVDSLVAAYQRETYAPGLSVAVVRGGRDTLVYRGYGFADLAHDVPATPRTVYRIGSVGKQFTAAAVLQLAEEKRLSLDDPIGRYVADVPAAWRDARVRQLLNHTAGIPGYTAAPAYERASRDELSPESAIDLVRNEPLDFAPGTAWKYSNTGYVLLGLLVEQVSEQTYPQYLESRILEPSGLTNTRYCNAETLIEHRATGYVPRDTGLVNARAEMTVRLADGELCSTVGDLGIWNESLARGRVVSPASWTRMTTPEGAALPEGYGYGVAVTSLAGHRIVWHNGGVSGFKSDNAYLPDDSLSITVLTNLGYGNPHELVMSIARAALASSPSLTP
jgi:D-alanyl-D-alanine carboxypeptidase